MEDLENKTSGDGMKWSTLNSSFLAEGAVWVGAKISLYAVSDQDIVPAGKVFFDYFKVTAGLYEW